MRTYVYDLNFSISGHSDLLHIFRLEAIRAQKLGAVTLAVKGSNPGPDLFLLFLCNMKTGMFYN